MLNNTMLAHWRNMYATAHSCAGLFIFGYCFYYWARSEMTGFMQTSFFFGYMAMIWCAP